MVNIAVAGGLGNVGKTIVEVLKEDPRHNVIILSRKADDNAPVPVKLVDYDKVDSLKETLETNQIHTVISAVSVFTEEAFKGQVNLTKAAAAASTTKRFVASDYGTPLPEESMPHLKFRAAALEELKKTDLEWTRFHNGYFLDYFGMPHVKSNMTPLAFVIDVENKFAAIPGNGDDIVTFTYTYDVARFVHAALDLPAGEWPEISNVIGDRLTFNELLRLAEDVRGSKFEVHYDSPEKLKTGQITELPGHKRVYPFFPKEALQGMFSAFEQAVLLGAFDLQEENSLNRRFPRIKTLKAKELLEQSWKGKQ